MGKEYSEKEIRNILKEEAELPKCVEEKIQRTYREIHMDAKVEMRYMKSYRARKVMVAAAVLILAVGLVGFAANVLLKVNIKEDTKHVSYEVEVNRQREAHAIEVTPTYMPEGYVQTAADGPYGGKWRNEETDCGITIAPFNAAELYLMSQTNETFFESELEDTTYLKEIEINGMRQDIFLSDSPYQDSEKSRINLFLSNEEYGYMVWISSESTLSQDEILKVAEGLKIEVLDETVAYATDEEIEALKKDEEMARQKEAEEEALREEYGIPSENIHQIGEKISNPFIEKGMAESYGDIEYTVESVEITDSLDPQQYPVENYTDYEAVTPWINEDGTLKPHLRYEYDSKSGEELGLQEVTSKFVVVKMKAKNVSDVTNEYVSAAPGLSVHKMREDGNPSWYNRMFLSGNEDYSLQWGAGWGANFPIYFDGRYFTEGIEAIKSAFYVPLESQEEISYTLVYVADEDVLDEVYLRFDFGGNQPHMVDGKWTTEQYVKVK